MTSDTSMNPRQITASLIRVVVFIQFAPLVLNVANIGWFAITYFLKPFDQQYFLTQVVPNTFYLAANGTIYLLIFFNADKLARLMFPSEEAIILSGDPYSWALPALQITGLIFCVGAISALLPIIQTFREHLYNSSNGAVDRGLDRTFWNETWSAFIRLLVGFLIFRNPKWLVNTMRHFSQEAH